MKEAEIERLQKLKENGVLTEEEFNQEKARVLSGENYNTRRTYEESWVENEGRN
mgnify:CR=1 FL=1